VPEVADQGALFDCLLRALFPRDTYAQSRADQADEPVSEGDDDAENNALAKSEATGIVCDFARGGRFAGSGFRHDVIVTGSRARAKNQSQRATGFVTSASFPSTASA
jgi:hypothetical protein